MEDANAVLADEKATQETVDAMLQSLEEAYGKLEVAETPDPQPEVDKTALQAKVDECSKLNEKDYTEASWKDLRKHLKKPMRY